MGLKLTTLVLLMFKVQRPVPLTEKLHSRGEKKSSAPFSTQCSLFHSSYMYGKNEFRIIQLNSRSPKKERKGKKEKPKLLQIRIVLLMPKPSKVSLQ